MSNFALIKIEAVKGRQKFYKLVKDGICEFDEFEAEARRNFNSEMNTIYRRFNSISLGRRLPLTQNRILDGGIKNVTECEVKSKHLRIYYFIDKFNGNIVILGGYKKNQKRDIKHFENIVKTFIENKGNQ